MCAHAVRVAVKQIDGVDSVAVSLNRGLVVIVLRPDNRVTLAEVRQSIRDNGFTPKEAELRARGTVVDDGGRLGLAMPGGSVAFQLAADARAPGVLGELRRALGQAITIEGRVPETARRAREPLVFHVRGAHD